MQEQIIGFLRMHGPTMPSQLAKHLHTEILLASAMLSEAVAQGKVKVSSLKIGGSPLYYLPGQEAQLERFAAGNLNPKDLAVLQKLKQQHVLREAQMDLLEKVSVRSLKDFAVPLQVTTHGTSELFWKWHLSTQQEVHDSISALLSPPEITPTEPIAPQPVAPSVLSSPAASMPHEAARISASATMPEKKDTVEQQITKPVIAPRKQRKKYTRQEEEFFPLLEESFKKLKISIEQKETIRKNAELEFILKVPSAVGIMTYFCKAKNKSKCDEKDLSAAYMRAQMKKLPLLFVHTGELSKKAQEILESGAMENVVVRKIN